MATPASRLAGGALLGLGLYHGLLRPRLLRLGATREEARRTLPGDELVRDPFLVSTRAVSIAAPPASVFPWLVQMGDGRGGLYSFDVLDRLFGYLSAPSATTVLPQFQHLAPGDVIPIGRGPDWPVAEVVPDRALVVAPVEGSVSWCWALAPDGAGTRLLSRVRVRVSSRALLAALGPAVDVPWLVMEREMLRGIRRRAERLQRGAAWG